jgi:hypothetical protein
VGEEIGRPMLPMNLATGTIHRSWHGCVRCGKATGWAPLRRQT